MIINKTHLICSQENISNIVICRLIFQRLYDLYLSSLADVLFLIRVMDYVLLMYFVYTSRTTVMLLCSQTLANDVLFFCIFILREI